MHLFTIMPIDTNYVEEICEDIKYQYENGIADCALFKMTLHPEGTPPANKAEILTEGYKVIKNRLDKMGLKSGILVQASIGHGYSLGEDSPFSKYVNLNNGNKETVCCPYDDGFCEYIENAMSVLAEAEPDIIMVDDDLRLIFRQGNGCACSAHMRETNKILGKNLSREELFERLKADNECDEAKAFVKTQGEAVIKAAKAMRRGIDKINPDIPGAFCCSGNNMEFAVDIAKTLAGKDNKIIIRTHNTSYVPAGTKHFTHNLYRAAKQIAIIKNEADTILAECDTIPYSQYGVSAQWFHTNYVGMLLEGATGAKLWISNLMDFEPESGKAFRKILEKNQGFYKKISGIVRDLKYTGCCIPLTNEPQFFFSEWGWDSSSDGGDGWSTYALERLGLPLYFSDEYDGAIFLSGVADKKFNDEEMRKMLEGAVVLSYDTAKRLCDRGFKDYIGVEVREWQGQVPNIERIFATGKLCDAQKNAHELIPVNDEVKTDSMIYHTIDNKNYTPLFPGTTVYKNPIGGTVIVFAGTPVVESNYIEGFSFLNWSRKQQLIKLLSECGQIPIYYEGGEEVYLKAAKMSDEKMFCSIFNFGFDIIEEVVLKVENKVSKIKMVQADGSFKECTFSENDSKIRINETVYPLNPAIFIIE